MSHTATDTVLQVIGIRAFLQHLLIIIGFEKNGMALPEIVDHLFTGNSDICENTHCYRIARNNKTMWVAGIVLFRKSNNRKCANTNRFMRLEGSNQLFIKLQPRILMCCSGDINRQPVFF